MPQKVPALAVVAVALAVWMTGCARTPPARRGRPAPDAVGKTLVLEAPRLNGAVVQLAPGSGKVRVLDFWASWCQPCRASLPHLDGLAREFGGAGVEVFGVAVADDEAEVESFLAEVPVAFPILWDQGGVRSTAAKLPVVRLPTTLIVDRRGVIRFVHEGWTERVAREQRDQVRALLRE